MQSRTEVKAECPSASGESQRGWTVGILSDRGSHRGFLSRESSAVGMGCWWALRLVWFESGAPSTGLCLNVLSWC